MKLLLPAVAAAVLGSSIIGASALYQATWHVRDGYASPDCVEKLVATINDQIPGPELRVAPNEDVEITVVNEMRTQAVSIHWHGMHHVDGTVWQDGAAGVTGCPIAPMTSWVYRFKVNDRPGTFQYHGHIGGLRSAGIGGPLIIEGDVSPFFQEAGTEKTFLLNDWYHNTAANLVNGLLQSSFRWAGDGDSITVNGKGFFNCTSNDVYTCAGEDGRCEVGGVEYCGAENKYYQRYGGYEICSVGNCPGYEKVTVTSGQTALLRFINGGSLMNMNVAVEGHNMTIVEVDGHPTQKLEVSSFDVNSGQRISVLVAFNQGPGTYTMKIKQRSRGDLRTGYALIEVADAQRRRRLSSGASVDPAEAEIEQPAWDDNNFTFEQQNAIRGYYEGAEANEAMPEEVERTFVFLSTQEWFTQGEYSNGNPSSSDLSVAVGEASNRPQDFCTGGEGKNLKWAMGRRTWRSGTTPSLSRLYFDIDSESINEENSYYAVELGKAYDVVIQNYPACNSVCETHAWHLHGSAFWVLGAGRGEWTGSTEQWAALNTVDPPVRDTVMTIGDEHRPFGSDRDAHAPCGYVVIRFKVVSPGMWYFHCHQLWHVVMGSNVAFYTAQETLPAPPENLLLCGGMTARGVARKLLGAEEDDGCGDGAANAAARAFSSWLLAALPLVFSSLGSSRA